MAECNYSAGALATVKKMLYGGKAEGINNTHCSSGCNGDATVALLSTSHNNFKQSGFLSYPSLWVSEPVSVWKSLCTHENRGAVLKGESGAVAFPTRLQQPSTWFIYTKTTSDSSHTIATCRPVRSPWWTSQRQQGRASEWVNRDEEWRVLNELVDWDLCIQHSVYKKEKENVILRYLDAF